MVSLTVKIVIGYSSVLFALHRKLQTNLRLISIVISPLSGSEGVGGEGVRRWEVGGSVAKSRPEFLSRSQWKQIMLPSIWRLTKTYSDQHSTQHPRFYNTSTTLCVSQCAQGFQERSHTSFSTAKSLNPIWDINESLLLKLASVIKGTHEKWTNKAMYITHINSFMMMKILTTDKGGGCGCVGQ